MSNNDLISREYLRDAFDNLCCHNCKICRNFRNEDSFYKCALIENALPVDAYTFNQVKELFDLNVQMADEIENLKRPQGEWVEVKHRLNLLIGVLYSNQLISHDDIEYIEDSIKKLMNGGNNETS